MRIRPMLSAAQLGLAETPRGLEPHEILSDRVLTLVVAAEQGLSAFIVVFKQESQKARAYLSHLSHFLPYC